MRGLLATTAPAAPWQGRAVGLAPDAVPFVSTRWDYEKHQGALQHAVDSPAGHRRAMQIVASTFLSSYSYLATTWGVDEASRIMRDALEAVETKHRNADAARAEAGQG